MTQTNGQSPQSDRLSQVESALARFINASDERMTRVEQQTAENSQAIQALTQSQQAGFADVISMIGSLAHGQEEQGRRIDQLLTEAAQDRQQAAQDRQEIRSAVSQINQVIQRLEAANERQERINDFLMRQRGLN